MPSSVEWGIFTDNCRASMSSVESSSFTASSYGNRGKSFPVLGHEGV